MSRRLLALLSMIERRTVASAAADPVDVDDAVIDAWFGRHSPLFPAVDQPRRR